jgi:glycerophosphoryl diester phosphodiesterase
MTNLLLTAVVACLGAATLAVAAADPRPPAGPAAAKKPVELTGHRGESHDAPENTLASYALAWERGVAAAELDVHLTKDGQLILSHDGTTERLAKDKAKLVIKNSTADELRKLDVGSWKDPKYAGERMPLLSEALAPVPAGHRMFVEVKIGPEAVPELAKVFEKSGKSPDQLVVIAFNLDTCREAKKALPKHKVYFLSNTTPNKKTKAPAPTAAELIAKAKSAGVDGLDLQASDQVDAAFVAAVKAAGLEVYVWTIDDPAKVQMYVDAGVDGVTTNRPSWMRGQVKETR